MLFNCKCPKENKVLVKECEFLKDKRELRKMVTGGIDKKRRLNKKESLNKQVQSPANKEATRE